MNLICAVDENWAIGKDNDLLFPIPEDLKNFRRLTIDHNVICGKNTLFSFPGQKPLPRRKHFVLTHSSLEETEQLAVAGSIEMIALGQAEAQAPQPIQALKSTRAIPSFTHIASAGQTAAQSP